MSTISKRNFELLYKDKDYSHILSEVLAKGDIFESNKLRQDFEGSPFKDCRSIICRLTFDEGMSEDMSPREALEFRASNGVTNVNAVDQVEYGEVPLVYNEVMSIASALRAEQIGRVAVTELAPGGHILAHRDFGAYHDFYDRIHIVLGGEGCHFRCGAEVVKMLPGEVWIFNNRDVHEVWNYSNSYRYHLVIDLKLSGSRVVRWPVVKDYANNMEFLAPSVEGAKVNEHLRKESLVYAVEELSNSLIAEVTPLLTAHYEELALNKEHVPLSPIWEKYQVVADNKELFILTCRKAGKLIGYFVGFVQPSLHYSTCLTCSMDIFFISKEYRGGSLGIKLFRAVEKELRLRKVQRWFVGSKEHADASKLFERLKFTKVETYYSKWLGE